MSINWDMAGRGNNALAYFQMGQQLGQQIIDGRVNRAVGKIMQADQPGQMPNGQAPDLSGEWETVARYNPEMAFKMKQRQAEQAEAARKREMENRQTFRQLLQMAGTNPQQAFAAARQLGIPLNNVPQPGTPEFEPWRQTQLFILKAAETPEGKDMLTNAAKEYMLTLPPDQRDPNNPAFYQGFGKYLEAQQVKTIPFTQGGGVAGYSPMTGQTTTIVAPNPGGFAAGTPVGGANLPRVNSPDEARRLPPGSQFILPDGRIGTVPGGQPAGAGPFAQ